MSPERTSPNGQYRTDWTRKDVGRIRLTYGYTLTEHTRAVQLLNDLYDNNQLEVLRAIKARKVSVRTLLAAKKAGRHRRDDVLVDLRLQQPLWSTLEAMAKKRGGKVHQSARSSMMRKFARTAGGVLGANAKVADLARLDWQALRPSFASPADWNHLRMAIGTALSELLDGPEHPFRKALMKKVVKETEPRRDVDVSVDEFWALVAALPEAARPGVVTLAATAMRLETEYLRCKRSDKRPDTYAVYCPGSKTADAAGLIPVAESLWEWVDAGIPAPLKKKMLREHFHRAAVTVGLGRYEETGTMRRQRVTRDRSGPPASGEAKGPIYKDLPVLRYKGITLHDLRHLALQLALDGGAQLNDVQSFARHADPAMTMRYLKRAGQRRAADAIGRTLMPEEKKA